jgi:4-amino-4-deoxy-L-arabinose transferase-like glycosyltransferase
MIESNNFKTPYFQTSVRAKKPLGIYHLQTLSALIFGPEKIVSYRIPSVLFSLLCALLVSFVFFKLLPTKFSFIASLLYICSMGILIEAKLARADAALLFFCNLQQFSILSLMRRNTLFSKMFSLFGFWTGLIGGIMLKGFITPILATTTLLTLFFWEGNWKRIKRLHFEFGLSLFALILVPYFYFTFSHNPDFFSQCIQEDFIPKLISFQGRHSGFPGLTSLFLVTTFFPGSLFLPFGLYNSLSLLNRPTVRFMLSWALPFLFILEIIPQKLPTYSLPLFAPFTYISVLAFKITLEKKISFLKLIVGSFYPRIVLFLSFGFSALVWISYFYFKGSLYAALCISTLNVFLYIEGVKASARHINSHLYCFLFCYALTTILITGWALPSTKNLFASQDISDALQKYGRKKTVLVGYSEPSVIFLLGTDTLIANVNNIAQVIEKETSFHLVVPKEQEEKILLELEKRHIHGSHLQNLETYYATKGKRLSLALYTFEN